MILIRKPVPTFLGSCRRPRKRARFGEAARECLPALAAVSRPEILSKRSGGKDQLRIRRICRNTPGRAFESARQAGILPMHTMIAAAHELAPRARRAIPV